MPTTFLIIGGDSVVRGTGASTRELRWVSLVANAFRPSIEICDSAMGGATSRDLMMLLARLSTDETEVAPALLALGVGDNDSRFRPSLGTTEVPLAEFRSNLCYFFEAARELRSPKLCLIGQFPVIDEIVNPYKPDIEYYRDNQRPCERAMATMGEEYEIAFVPVFDSVLERGEEYVRQCSRDGLHPNDMGHRHIAREVLLEVKSL